jgi:hypothetical protein
LRDVPDVVLQYTEIESAALGLCIAVKEDFPVDCDLVFDINNNLLMLKDNGKHNGLIAAIDRFGKPISRRLTTKRVADAILSYTQACEQVTSAVKKALQTLSQSLMSDIGTIIQVFIEYLFLGFTN